MTAESLLLRGKLDAYIVSKGKGIQEDSPGALSTALSTIKPTGNVQIVSFPFWIDNLTLSEATCYLNKATKLDTGWSCKIYIDSTEITTFPYSIKIAPCFYAQGRIDISMPANCGKARLGSVTLLFKTSDGYIYDSIRAILASWIADFDDMKKEAEMLAISEALFPSSGSVTAQAANEFLLSSENETLYSECLNALDGVSIAYENLARQLITNRVLERLLLRYAAYTLGGDVAYIRIIRQLKERIADMTLSLESVF